MTSDHVLLDLGMKLQDTADSFYEREIIRHIPLGPAHGSLGYMAWMGLQRGDTYWRRKFFDEVDRHRAARAPMHPDARAAVERAHQGWPLKW